MDETDGKGCHAKEELADVHWQVTHDHTYDIMTIEHEAMHRADRVFT